MRNISEAGLAALSSSRIKQGHLVALELPDTILYLTDYMRDVVFNNITYRAGKIKQLSNYTQTRDLTTQNLTLTISGLDTQYRELFFASSKSFLGKRATIYRAFFDDNGDIIPFTLTTGEPFIYYKGKIATATLDDSSPVGNVGSATIKYTISNDFYDIESVQGRFTSDASHRALVTVNGKLVPSGAAKRPEYQNDLGFYHADTSVNILAKYQTKELRYKIKSKRAGGLGGLMGKKNMKLVEYYADVEKEVSLDLNLTAKYLPVVYGCQKVPGIPIFCDTEVDNPNSVWIVYAVCEGEIEGFLDIFIDDNPIICYDDADDADRVCFGRRKNVGDTINKIAIGGAGSGPSNHGSQYNYVSPDGDITFWTYHGKPNQEAAWPLTRVASEYRFHLQSVGNYESNYWNSDMRLLDTAYVVVNIKITENRTSIPSFDFEVLGRKVRKYDANGNIISSGNTTRNLSWQILDYATSKVFGPGIPLSALHLPSFIEAAAVYDAIDTSYEGSWCPYWRSLGWSSYSNSNRQILQTNVLLDTANTIFKNVQNMLAHGDASLNTFSGKYYLTVEKNATPVIELDYNDIIGGEIAVEDTSGKDRYNSVQANIIDPGKGWNSSAVTFYNSVYLTEDNNTEKKMNLVFDYITNYYTARSMAERHLKRSRFIRTYSLSLPFKYIGLLPNDVVTFKHPRFPEEANRVFIIDSIESTTSGKFNIDLQETNADVFITSPQADASSSQIPVVTNIILPPRELKYDPYVLDDPGDGTVDPTVLKNGTLSWRGSLSTGIVSYSIKQTGMLEAYEVVVSPGQNSDSIYRLDLFKLAAGEYTFEVRAIDVFGFNSKPGKITVTIDSAKNLTNITNFKLVNTSISSVKQFTGNFMHFVWDPSADLAIYPYIFYNLQIISPLGNLLQDLNITGTTEYTYEHTNMINDYKKENGGSLGIYREYVARIKAVGTEGQESVSWTYVNDLIEGKT